VRASWVLGYLKNIDDIDIQCEGGTNPYDADGKQRTRTLRVLKADSSRANNHLIVFGYEPDANPRYRQDGGDVKHFTTDRIKSLKMVSRNGHSMKTDIEIPRLATNILAGFAEPPAKKLKTDDVGKNTDDAKTDERATHVLAEFFGEPPAKKLKTDDVGTTDDAEVDTVCVDGYEVDTVCKVDGYEVDTMCVDGYEVDTMCVDGYEIDTMCV